MASYLRHLAFLFTLLSLLSALATQGGLAAYKPKTLFLTLQNHRNMLTVNIRSRTPTVSVPYVVDLTAAFLWANCETNYQSSTLSYAKCGSSQCSTANTSFCHTCGGASSFCHTNVCGLLLENPATHQSTIGQVAQDVISLKGLDGLTRGPFVPFPNFLFTCAPSLLVQLGLPKAAQGVAGFANHPISLPNQIAKRVGFNPVFSICVPDPDGGHGVVLFGEGPYVTFPAPKWDMSTSLKYSPLIISPFREYYFTVKSISFNGKKAPVDPSKLIIDERAVGGVTFSTTAPYTVLEGSVYKAVMTLISNEMSGIPRVKSVAPFELCFDSRSFHPTSLGPGMPSIDLEMEGGEVWPFFGLHSIVEPAPGTYCIALVNGGFKSNYRAGITIGLYQMKEVLIQIDLARSRVGHLILAGARTACGNFNVSKDASAMLADL